MMKRKNERMIIKAVDEGLWNKQRWTKDRKFENSRNALGKYEILEGILPRLRHGLP